MKVPEGRYEKVGAVERIRTFTVLLPPAPQAGASASSATTAKSLQHLIGCANVEETPLLDYSPPPAANATKTVETAPDSGNRDYCFLGDCTGDAGAGFCCAGAGALCVVAGFVVPGAAGAVAGAAGLLAGFDEL